MIFAEALAELADALPDGIKPDWLYKLKEAGRDIEKFGGEKFKWGADRIDRGLDAIKAWGDGAKAVDRWFDDREKKFAATARLMKGSGGVSLSGAFGQGTQEAQSIIAKNLAGSIVAKASSDTFLRADLDA